MRALAPFLLVFALATPAGAEHCESFTTSAPEVAVAGYYVDITICQPDCGPYLDVYEESNGIDGLQRADDLHDDTCHGMVAGDTLHFDFGGP